MALRVLSYNILSGGEDRLSLLVNVIRKQQPDVVAILEANNRSNVETLASELEMQLTFGEANSEFHVAWLSRLPLVRAENHRLPVFAKTLLEIELIWQGSPVHLFATHLWAGRDQLHHWLRLGEMRTILDIMRPLSGQLTMLVGDLNAVHPTDR